MAPLPLLRRAPAVLAAGVVLSGAGLLSAFTSAYAAGPEAAGPTCQPWQTVTHLPLPTDRSPP